MCAIIDLISTYPALGLILATGGAFLTQQAWNTQRPRTRSFIDISVDTRTRLGTLEQTLAGGHPSSTSFAISPDSTSVPTSLQILGRTFEISEWNKNRSKSVCKDDACFYGLPDGFVCVRLASDSEDALRRTKQRIFYTFGDKPILIAMQPADQTHSGSRTWDVHLENFKALEDSEPQGY
ncbi:hypothetical protein FB451DRAFT_1190280 [Mycena latifolia]|nr:hypothetical protein FB451DRAFT_1190280 [Mycena latifolia]